MSGKTLRLRLVSAGRDSVEDVTVNDAVIAGWTGRDRAAVEKHVAELEALGVRRPSTTPVFYRVSAARLTTDDAVEMLGSNSSGEVEFVLLQTDGQLWIGAGSDHTDREVEAYDVAVSKQVCDKPVAPLFWSFDEVADHWDQLVLRSWIVDSGERVLYQEGSVTAMLAPLDLIGRHAGAGGLTDGTLMFCGTLAARGGVRRSPMFAFELTDPRLGRSIRHEYRMRELPLVR